MLVSREILFSDVSSSEMTISPTNLTVVHALNSCLTGKNAAAFQFHSWNVYFYIKCALWLTYSGIQHVLLVLYLLKWTSHYYARTRRQWQSQHQASETPENLKVGSTCFHFVWLVCSVLILPQALFQNDTEQLCWHPRTDALGWITHCICQCLTRKSKRFSHVKAIKVLHESSFHLLCITI